MVYENTKTLITPFKLMLTPGVIATNTRQMRGGLKRLSWDFKRKDS